MTALKSAAPVEPGSADRSLRPAGAVRCEVIGDATLYLADSAGCLSVINTSISAEAKRIIMQDLTPFEQQMARIATGAQQVAALDLRTGGPDYPLGGISTGMI